MCTKRIITVIILNCILVIKSERLQSCLTPNGESAICMSIFNCSTLLKLVGTRNYEQLRFLRASECDFISHPLVCCGTKDNYEPTNNVTARGNMPNMAIPDRSGCGIQETDKIYRGQMTALDEFPWMALLQYSKNSDERRWACGGSLISSRYVLTVAHCVTGPILKRVGKLVNVRLGEWNISQEIDCDIFNNCKPPPEDFDIEDVHVHEGYNPNNIHRYDDIALIRVSRTVTFRDNIKPICLPLPNEASEVGDKLIVAGWGETEKEEHSNVKQKLQVPLTDRSQCLKNFALAGIILKNSQLCAGGEKGKDSCAGDSGGPLMTTTKNDTSQWYLEGIISFGAICGTEGWPGVYTKVSDYIPWIHETVKK